MDLLEAQTGITVSTTAYAWENFGLWSRSDSEDYGAQLLIVYEAPEYVKEELAEADAKLEQKAIGRDALVFIVNEENPVQSLTQQQLRDIYAGRITSWKDVGGADAPIVAFQRGVDSGSQTLFKKLLIDKGDGQLMAAPTELAPPTWAASWTASPSTTTPPTPSAFRSTTTSTRCTRSPASVCWPWTA